MSAGGGAGRVRVAAHGGVQLSCLRAGPVGGEPVVLLHGFPEDAELGWRHQLPALAAAGLRAWAPDQRGCGESDRPPRVRGYVIGNLAADAQAVLDAAAREAGRARAHLVAHDWGGGVAWWVALASPERVASLTVLNCPHPLVLRRALARHPRQMARSWYMLFFQLPWLPEALAGARRAAWLATLVRRSGRPATALHPATFDDATLERYRALWSRPGALRAMIDWYRALRHAPRRPPGPPDGRVRVPVRMVWGTGDTALGVELAAPSVALCEAGELVLLEGATHWVQHDEPGRVAGLIVDWVRAHPAPRQP